MNDLIETNYDNSQMKINKKQVAGADLLFNKNKISSEIASLSSMSSMSSQSSIRSEPREKINIIKKNNSSAMPNNKFKSINDDDYDNDDTDNEDDDDDDDIELQRQIKKKQMLKKQQIQNKKKVIQNDKDDEEDDDNEVEDDDEDDEDDEVEDDEEDGDDDEDDVRSNASGGGSGVKKIKNELTEKREILYQLNRLQAKGYNIPFNFTMQSDLQEMKNEYDKIVRDKDVDGSIRFQRKMLMAFVTGTEYLNNRYDPFSIKLEGWSEQIHENILDYDDIFEELHDKYKAKGKKMAPELRLFISLTGSAFMFHLTSRMFKESSIPGVEEVFKSNPELMKQFQNAAAKQFVYKNTGLQEPSTSNRNINNNSKSNNSGGGGMGGGLFGMIGNLFGGLTNTSFPQQPTQQQQSPQIQQQNQYNHQQFRQSQRQPDKSFNDINNIINNVHSKISPHLDEDNKIETLSISDEEITSIIEDATDVRILKSSVRGRKPNNKDRTLNI